MSKYIKLEDAIEQVKTEFYGGGYQEWLEISIDNLINRIANLPTIEVSEDNRIDNLLEQADNLIAFEKDLLADCEEVPSEDCISREYLKSLGYINKGDFNSVETIREWIDNAPSVVPTVRKNRQVERAEGEWIDDDKINHKYHRCSECGIGQFNWGEDNYCPNCGAKMKGAEE